MDPDKWSFATRPAREACRPPDTVIECRHPDLPDFVMHIPADAPAHFDTPEKRAAFPRALEAFERRNRGRA